MGRPRGPRRETLPVRTWARRPPRVGRTSSPRRRRSHARGRAAFASPRARRARPSCRGSVGAARLLDACNERSGRRQGRTRGRPARNGHSCVVSHIISIAYRAPGMARRLLWVPSSRRQCCAHSREVFIKIPFFGTCALVTALAGCAAGDLRPRGSTAVQAGTDEGRSGARGPGRRRGDLARPKCTDHPDGTTTGCTRLSCVTSDRLNDRPLTVRPNAHHGPRARTFSISDLVTNFGHGQS